MLAKKVSDDRTWFEENIAGRPIAVYDDSSNDTRRKTKKAFASTLINGVAEPWKVRSRKVIGACVPLRTKQGELLVSQIKTAELRVVPSRGWMTSHAMGMFRVVGMVVEAST